LAQSMALLLWLGAWTWAPPFQARAIILRLSIEGFDG